MSGGRVSFFVHGGCNVGQVPIEFYSRERAEAYVAKFSGWIVEVQR